MFIQTVSHVLYHLDAVAMGAFSGFKLLTYQLPYCHGKQSWLLSFKLDDFRVNRKSVFEFVDEHVSVSISASVFVFRMFNCN